MKKRQEQKLHTWIEEQNREEKDRAKAALFQRENERLQAREEKSASVKFSPPKSRLRFLGGSAVWKGLATALCVCLIVIAGIYGLQHIDAQNIGQSESGSSKQDQAEEAGGGENATSSREELANDDVTGELDEESGYTVTKTQIRLKDCEGLLYLDWYDRGEWVGEIWTDSQTEQVVCRHERIEDKSTACYVHIWAPEDRTFHGYWNSLEDHTDEQREVKGITVYYTNSDTAATAYFDYGGRRYYVDVDAPPNGDYLFSVLEALIP